MQSFLVTALNGWLLNTGTVMLAEALASILKLVFEFIGIHLFSLVAQVVPNNLHILSRFDLRKP